MLKRSRLLTRPTLARQDAPFRRQGRRRVETGGVPLGYVEDFDELRTPLADFFSILLFRVSQIHRPIDQCDENSPAEDIADRDERKIAQCING